MNALFDELAKIDATIIISTHHPDDGEVNLIGKLAAPAFMIEGPLDRAIDVVIAHGLGKDSAVVTKLVTACSVAMNSQPIFHVMSSVPENIMAAGVDCFGLNLDFLQNVAYDKYIWDTFAPEATLRHMLNDVRDRMYEFYLTGEILNGRKIEDYIDPKLTAAYKKAQEDHVRYAGVYGLDPVDLDCPRIDHMCSIGLFLELVSTFELSGSQQDELREDYLKRLICQREHISISEPSSEHRLEVGEEFDAWFDHYTNCFKEHDDEWFDKLTSACANSEDLSEFMPKGTWRITK